ncbi:hypothetical protein U0070_007584 [Myodes glareolus]|uniref:DH domain-containing protein n=1 Tax=Myodes glareolus TaxID=447135 RepID=A0AAW0H127_MYOGA
MGRPYLAGRGGAEALSGRWEGSVPGLILAHQRTGPQGCSWLQCCAWEKTRGLAQVNYQPNMTLLSSQSSSLAAPSGSVSPEKPEQRMLEKRAKVVAELVQTEKDYIRDLEMCIERVMVPLQQAQVPNIDFEGLFGNMETVIKVSKQLLAALEISDAVGMSLCSRFCHGCGERGPLSRWCTRE